MSPRRESTRLLMTADAAGGVWTYALDLAGGLAARGVITTLAVLGPAPNDGQRAQAEAVPGLQLRLTDLPLDWLAEGPEPVLAAAGSLAALARETGADLVHLNSPAHAAGAAFPVPVVAVSHSCTATWWDAVRGGDLPEDFAWRAALLRRGLLAADAVITPSHAFAEATARRYTLPRPPVAVHNGRRPLVAPGGGAEVPDLFALTVGRLWDTGKGLDLLDRVAARVQLPVLAAGPINGPDGTRAKLNHIRPLGNLDEPALVALLARKPILVSLALYEPFGLAVTEAAQCGCPLVLSDIPTFRELWDGAALFVPARDEAAVAAALNKLAESPEERARLGAAARARAARYTVEAMTEATLAVYRGVLMQGTAAA
ncbi:glycosyltransferase family 4 protein [Roseomonas sp. WA12]